MAKGKLYLIPNLLGTEASLESSLPQQVFNIINEVDVFIVENEKEARRYLKKLGIKCQLNDIILKPISKHTDQRDIAGYLNDDSKTYGLISDAGCPAVADPGAQIVDMAHQKQIKVIPMVGPSSILLSVMGSGFNGQSFAFHGYLPIAPDKRNKRLKELEAASSRFDQTQLFIETPYRNNQLMEALVKHLDKNTKICVASNLTLDTEYIVTKRATAWRVNMPDLHKKPTVFLIYAR